MWRKIMIAPLSRLDYEYILESLIYARYAHEQTHYPTEALRHLELARLGDIENKLRALRDASPTVPHREPNAELF
jgi:hypothetical protein